MTMRARACCGALMSPRMGSPSRERISNIESKQDHIAVLNFVLFCFTAHLPGGTSGLLPTQIYVIVIGDSFSADETALEVAVDRAGRRRRSPAAVNRPGVGLFRAGGEKRLE